MTGEWQDAVTEAQDTTGFTGNVVPRTVEGIGTALRIDRRTEFYAELSALGDPGGFDAFLNHWWTQALADSAPDGDAREQAVDFADVTVSLYARLVEGPTATQAEINAFVAGAEAS
ncbi:hypothetical protein ACIF9R_11030 [Streptomyces sp. NPDC086080]|uniref:hypothetical protein n=1 Tax=Streptomyces sp. NPDC086080 TaxID=3365748 RepID=UPI0037CE3284